MNNKMRSVIMGLTCYLVLCASSVAFAQLPTPTGTAVATSFKFSVPVALTVSHPCKAGFVLIRGAVNIDLTTVTGTDFKFELNAVGSGTGEVADATGLPLGGQTPYAFDGAAKAWATFPKGKPAFFAHTLTVDGLLEQPAGDSFALAVVLDIEYKYGVPSAPKIESIDVSCQQ